MVSQNKVFPMFCAVFQQPHSLIARRLEVCAERELTPSSDFQLPQHKTIFNTHLEEWIYIKYFVNYSQMLYKYASWRGSFLLVYRAAYCFRTFHSSMVGCDCTKYLPLPPTRSLQIIYENFVRIRYCPQKGHNENFDTSK